MKINNQTKLAGAVALAFGLLPNAASAQSSVTLYGVVDAGINYISNAQKGVVGTNISGGRVVSLTDGAVRGLGGSRWGLKGSEDLGGGLAAIFQLENGFSVNTGNFNQGGAEFGQTAYVGLSSRAGTVIAGRLYSSQGDFMALYAPFRIFGAFGDAPGDIDGTGRTRRVNNAIRYTSTSFGNLKFSALYGFGGQAGGVAKNQTLSAALAYTQGDFSMGFGYFNAHDPNISTFGNNPNAGGATTNNLGSLGSATSGQTNPIYSGYASAHVFESYDAGMGYKMGPASVSVLVSHAAFRGLGDVAAGPNPLGYHGTAVFNSGTATLGYRLNPALEFGAAYMYMRGAGVGGHSGANYQEVLLSSSYSISKRTLWYAMGAYQFASGINSLGQSAVAANELLSASANSRQLVLRIGLRHYF